MQIKLISLLLIFYITPVVAQQWKSLGLEKEFISAIAVDSTNPEIIYTGSMSDFSAGTVGGIFRTTNGGAEWDTLIRGVTVTDLDIHPTNPKIIYATLGLNALTFPGIIKSIDGGNNWIKADSGMIINPESGGRVLVIDPIHPDTLYVCTSGFSGGTLYRSTNGGNSWSDLNSPTLSSIISMAIDPKDPDHIYIGTDDTGKIYETKDAGKSWIITGLTYKGIIYDIQLDPDSSKKIYAGTTSYGFYFSKDGGLTWEQNNKGLPNNASILKIQFLKDNNTPTIYINADASFGIYFLNKNAEWESYGNVGSWFIQIAKNKIYAGSYAGIYLSEELTSVPDKFEQPTSIFLYQNYPNPFNPTTVITYQLTVSSYITLKIYDILGREVATLVNEEKKAGSYAVNFNANRLASGIYFYQLTTDNFVVTKKMVLIR
jgi:photosystem II stability/assembly factor-like uncharacterized protein